MDKDEIREKLHTLDPKDDSLWTAEGLPRTSAVGEGVSRAEITAAAPLFRRTNLNLSEETFTEDELPETQLEPVEALPPIDRARENQRAIQEYLQSQLKVRKERAARLRDFYATAKASGLKKSELSLIGKSPIDRNIARRNRSARRNGGI
jgi:hypothetical protein